MPWTPTGELFPKEATLSTSKEPSALSVAWSNPVLQPSTLQYNRLLLSAGSPHSLSARRPDFAHLYLPVERWGPHRGKYCRKITSSVTTHSARALNFPHKGTYSMPIKSRSQEFIGVREFFRRMSLTSRTNCQEQGLLFIYFLKVSFPTF